MDEYDELFNINAEIRYLTLEIMKIALRKKKPFKLVAKEFVRNANTLQKLIKKAAYKQRC